MADKIRTLSYDCRGALPRDADGSWYTPGNIFLALSEDQHTLEVTVESMGIFYGLDVPLPGGAVDIFVPQDPFAATSPIEIFPVGTAGRSLADYTQRLCRPPDLTPGLERALALHQEDLTVIAGTTDPRQMLATLQQLREEARSRDMLPLVVIRERAERIRGLDRAVALHRTDLETIAGTCDPSALRTVWEQIVAQARTANERPIVILQGHVARAKMFAAALNMHKDELEIIAGTGHPVVLRHTYEALRERARREDRVPAELIQTLAAEKTMAARRVANAERAEVLRRETGTRVAEEPAQIRFAQRPLEALATRSADDLPAARERRVGEPLDNGGVRAIVTARERAAATAARAAEKLATAHAAAAARAAEKLAARNAMTEKRAAATLRAAEVAAARKAAAAEKAATAQRRAAERKAAAAQKAEAARTAAAAHAAERKTAAAQKIAEARRLATRRRVETARKTVVLRAPEGNAPRPLSRQPIVETAARATDTDTAPLTRRLPESTEVGIHAMATTRAREEAARRTAEVTRETAAARAAEKLAVQKATEAQRLAAKTRATEITAARKAAAAQKLAAARKMAAERKAAAAQKLAEARRLAALRRAEATRKAVSVRAPEGDVHRPLTRQPLVELAARATDPATVPQTRRGPESTVAGTRAIVAERTRAAEATRVAEAARVAAATRAAEKLAAAQAAVAARETARMAARAAAAEKRAAAKIRAAEIAAERKAAATRKAETARTAAAARTATAAEKIAAARRLAAERKTAALQKVEAARTAAAARKTAAAEKAAAAQRLAAEWKAAATQKAEAARMAAAARATERKAAAAEKMRLATAQRMAQIRRAAEARAVAKAQRAELLRQQNVERTARATATGVASTAKVAQAFGAVDLSQVVLPTGATLVGLEPNALVAKGYRIPWVVLRDPADPAAESQEDKKLPADERRQKHQQTRLAIFRAVMAQAMALVKAQGIAPADIQIFIGREGMKETTNAAWESATRFQRVVPLDRFGRPAAPVVVNFNTAAELARAEGELLQPMGPLIAIFLVPRHALSGDARTPQETLIQQLITLYRAFLIDHHIQPGASFEDD